MSLLDELKIAAEHLRQATRMAADWRVRDAVADAATTVVAALFIQQKIAAGELKIEHDPPQPWRREIPRPTSLATEQKNDGNRSGPSKP